MMSLDPGSLTHDVVQTVNTLQREIDRLTPQLLSGVIIFIVGVLLAAFFNWLTSSNIKWIYAGLPKHLKEKQILQSNVHSVANALGRIVFFVLFLLTLATSLNKIGLNVASSWFENIIRYLPNLLVAVLLLWIGWKIKASLSRLLFQGFSKGSFQHARAASNVVSWAAFTISALVAMQHLGIDMGLVITISAVIGGVVAGGIALTLALGARTTVSNIFSCYQIQKHLKIGHRVEVSGFHGRVDAIGPTYVILSTEEGKVTLPGDTFSQSAAVILHEEV